MDETMTENFASLLLDIDIDIDIEEKLQDTFYILTNL
jgi:hypothetical protein